MSRFFQLHHVISEQIEGTVYHLPEYPADEESEAARTNYRNNNRQHNAVCHN
jgi:hypothetical protein